VIAGFGFQTGIKRFPIDTAMLDQMTNDVLPEAPNISEIKVDKRKPEL